MEECTMGDEVKKFQIIGNLTPTEEETLQILMDMDIVQPVFDTNNVMYTDKNNKVYVL
jgi:hypothetical protein